MKTVMTTCSLMALAMLPTTRIAAAEGRPNVVVIMIDDLRDYVGVLGGHPQAKTPNIDRLARSGVLFTRAYSNDPVCAPSRSSMFTGIYPHVSRNFSFANWDENPTLANSKTMMAYYRDAGYRVMGAGKLMHNRDRQEWDEIGVRTQYGPVNDNGSYGDKVPGHPSVPQPFRSIGPIDGSFAPLSDVPVHPDGTRGWFFWEWNHKQKKMAPRPYRYVSENDRDPLPDEAVADWFVKRIGELAKERSGKPFFTGCGFIRPHTPLYAPKRFFDMYPVETVQLPTILPSDRSDTHFHDYLRPDSKGPRYFELLRQSYPSLDEGLRHYLQAYLACVAFVDEQVGKVVNAVDRGPFKDNTIIVLASDHGYNHGQKDFLFKNSPWEESVRIPLIVRAPGVARAGGRCAHPVSLIDVYPTLIDLCNLTGDTRKNGKGAPLSGHSLRPFLKDPKTGKWDGPDVALSVVYAGGRSRNAVAAQHYTVRSADWRYVLYPDGKEELYNHEADPHEWKNLADDPSSQNAKRQLKQSLLRMIGLHGQGSRGTRPCGLVTLGKMPRPEQSSQQELDRAPSRTIPAAEKNAAFCDHGHIDLNQVRQDFDARRDALPR